jgi:hypothetical protein
MIDGQLTTIEQVAKGLKSFDLSHTAKDHFEKQCIDIEVEVFADTPTVLSPLIQAWRSDEKTKMVYDAEMQWLEAKQGAKDCAFVSTTFDLEKGEKEKTVRFEQAFPKGSEVQVVGWVQSFRFGTEGGKDYACDFWATKVTPKGFTAHAECGENTERLTVTYIALKKGKEKVATGSFSTENDGEDGENAQEKKGRVDVEEGIFDKTPTVLVALSQFELAGGKDLRVGVEVEDVSESGFSWVIRKWISRILFGLSTNVDQVRGVTMRRALYIAQRRRSLLLGINNTIISSMNATRASVGLARRCEYDPSWIYARLRIRSTYLNDCNIYSTTALCHYAFRDLPIIAGSKWCENVAL